MFQEGQALDLCQVNDIRAGGVPKVLFYRLFENPKRSIIDFGFVPPGYKTVGRATKSIQGKSRRMFTDDLQWH